MPKPITNAGCLIRPAATTEMEAVASLFREYADTLGVDLSYQGFEAELAALPGAYAPPAGALLLAVSTEGALRGGVAVRPLAQAGTCEMKRLFVRPTGRGGGIGHALATAAIEAAAAAGYLRMRLDTLPTMTQAQSLYRHLGFEVTPPYYPSAAAGTIFMCKRLVPPRESTGAAFSPTSPARRG